jgi:hypothetical protein
MDPGEVPEELQGLTQVEEMLIAQIFLIISVYCLRGGQYAYRGNVINFPQDVLEFTTRLPRRPSSLDVLLVRHRSSVGRAFKDFNVRRSVVSCALAWLKKNNRYYSNIVIDEDVLRSLPENGPLDDQIPQIEDEGDDDDDEIDVDSDVLEDSLVSNFVPVPFPIPDEKSAIAETLTRLRFDTETVMWPNIDGVPVNEFQTPEYIACAFSTLYPTGAADLRSDHVRDVKPAEYFLHLLKYKDGRFARYTRWRYFALNSQMRWRALQEGKVYVRQSLSDRCCTVEDLQNMLENDSHMADNIVRFGEGLRGLR